MTVSATDFERFARQLIQGVTEIEWRNSASRLYYAAYHACQAQAHRCPDNSNLKMGSHEALMKRYELQEGSYAKSIAYILLAMKRIRCQADYDISAEFAKDAAEKQMTHHQNLSAKLRAFAQQFGDASTTAEATV